MSATKTIVLFLLDAVLTTMLSLMIGIPLFVWVVYPMIYQRVFEIGVMW